MLGNPLYAGRLSRRGQTLEGEHEAIVYEERWRKAAELMAARPKRGTGRPPKGRHLFRGGMLRCECGMAMVPRTQGKNEYYYCHQHSSLGDEFCSMTDVRRALID